MDSFDSQLSGFFRTYEKNKKPLEVNFREIVASIKNTDRVTHFIHPYPAKLLQHIPYFFLNNSLLSREGDTVLDPFCGTGTVLLESILSNRNAIGIDINPLAQFISTIKTTILKPDELELLLIKIKIRKNVKNQTVSKYFDEIKRDLGYWYDDETLNDLCSLKENIENIVSSKNRPFFQLCFSVCIKKMSLTDQRVSVPVRINQEKIVFKKNGKHLQNHLDFVKENDVTDVFCKIVNKNIKRYHLFKNLSQPLGKAKVFLLDSQKSQSLPISDNSIQLIISSPPYVSAQKYIRASKISMRWLDLDKLQSVKYSDQNSIGREQFLKKEYKDIKKTGFKSVDNIIKKIYKENPLRAHITATYIKEMKSTLQGCYKFLKPEGYFVLIIGNNTISGFEFKTHEFMIELALNLGFKLKLILIDAIKSRGLMTQRNKTANIITREYVLILKKE